MIEHLLLLYEYKNRDEQKKKEEKKQKQLTELPTLPPSCLFSKNIILHLNATCSLCHFCLKFLNCIKNGRHMVTFGVISLRVEIRTKYVANKPQNVKNTHLSLKAL